MKKLVAAFLAALMVFSFTACTNKTTPRQYYASLSKNQLTESDGYVKWQGRNYYDSNLQAVYFNLSASGFEVAFEGTFLKAELLGEWTDQVVGQGVQTPYVNVFLDGETDPTKAEKIEIYNKPITEYVIVKNLKNTRHTVRVLKCTETSTNKLALSALSTDGKILDAPIKSKLSIEVYGDSVTCGYGISATTQTSFSTDTEEALMTYGYLTARMLDADFSYIAASGWGLKHGLGADSSVVDWFEYADLRSESKWDNAANKPNIVIVNLGANDNQYILGNVLGNVTQAEKQQRMDNYISTYKGFINKLINIYGKNTLILCCYAMMRESNMYTAIQNMVYEEFQDKGKTNVHPIKLSEGINNQMALHGHPSYKTNLESAEILVKSIEDYSDFNRVRENLYV